jgi:hypothetical protein
MSKENDGGPAFPTKNAMQTGPTEWRYVGMTLRDYFAAKALSGFLANPDQDYAPLIDDKVPMLAREAYRLADAMLAAREEAR